MNVMNASSPKLTKIEKKILKKEKAKQKRKDAKNSTIAALAQTGAMATVALPINLFAVNNLPKASGKLSKIDKTTVNSAAEKVLNEVTNLGKKGVVINHVNPIKNLTRFPDKVLEMLNPIYATGKGANAFFASASENSSQAKNLETCGIKLNAVNINKEKLSLATFHELGHAFNYHNSKFWKTMQGVKGPFVRLASILALTPAILKNQKAEDGKELTPLQKINNFTRKVAPIASSLLLVPTVLEEGMASFRGNDWAKQLLNSSLAKQVKKTNAWGFLTYTVSAIAIGVAAYVGGKVRDHLEEKNAPLNQNMHQG